MKGRSFAEKPSVKSSLKSRQRHLPGDVSAKFLVEPAEGQVKRAAEIDVVDRIAVVNRKAGVYRTEGKRNLKRSVGSCCGCLVWGLLLVKFKDKDKTF